MHNTDPHVLSFWISACLFLNFILFVVSRTHCHPQTGSVPNLPNATSINAAEHPPALWANGSLSFFQLHGFKPSSHRIFRLNNIAKVLNFLEERNVSGELLAIVLMAVMLLVVCASRSCSAMTIKSWKMELLWVMLSSKPMSRWQVTALCSRWS